MAECSHYYKQSLDRLMQLDIVRPEETFWAGVFVGICEQVMMKVKPAGMIGSEMPRAEEITQAIAAVYGLHWMRLDRAGTERFEVWVCRPDDAETIAELTRLGDRNLSWGEYHRLR